MILLALQDEINALIEKQQALMGRLKNEKAIWGHGDDGDSLSPAELERQISILDNDRKKVKALESTIAVIGTMKAGKSTTINALIGEEVLPHRLLGMTTLPTLIRHKPGQKEPVMTLHNVASLKALVDEVRSKISLVDSGEDDNSKINTALFNVKSGLNEICDRYAGKENVQQALLLINDAFRLAGSDGFEIDVDRYIEEFSDIDRLPTVEIEFRCLADKPAGISSGSLALLDTPGPNEAGQSAVLKHVLAEQIAKNASMVLLVMNYTQLNTEQDFEIRGQLKGIKDVFRDRSFVVVNRFDEKKQNDLDEDQTRNLASKLLNDSLDDDDFITAKEVFPVSAHYAYIVEKVKKQIEQETDLNLFVRDEQNKDFIKAAFGMLDEDEIEELEYEQIIKKCDRLKRKSGYDIFTSNMLEKSYSMAAENSLWSALARLQDNAGKLDRLSTVVRGGLDQEMASLKESIDRTRRLGDSVESAYVRLEDVKNKNVYGYREDASSALSDHVADVKKSLRAEFFREREDLLEKLEGELRSKKGERKAAFIPSLWSRKAQRELKIINSDLRNLRMEIRGRANNEFGVVDFGEDKEAANKFLNKADEVVAAMFSMMADSFQEYINKMENKTRDDIENDIFGELGEICRSYEEEMQIKGFSFTVSMAESFSIDLSNNGVGFSGVDYALDEDKEAVPSKRIRRDRRSGWVHKTLKVLSFGYRDDYEETVIKETREIVRYRIEMGEYIERIERLADQFHKDVDSQIEDQFNKAFIPAVDDVFSRVFDSVKEIEEGLNKSKKLKEENMEVISEIKLMMNEVKASNSAHIKRISVASQGIQSMVSGNQESL
ncbi:MAG: hypothetical protein CL537_04915 [Alcanivoracaceae bacterium]|nr:hypothetical protein [Alcanivoracaceae bacterium]|tara:strand:- start:3171 stop:5672 length:2502 start_codon:yes stop_codon:yes gene_type:complete